MTAVVVTAAGSSVRMGGLKKEFRPSGLFDGDGSELSVLAASISPFMEHPAVGCIAVTIPEGMEARARGLLPSRFFSPEAAALLFVAGGSTRRASVHAALERLAVFNPERVLIHDGARPWVGRPLIDRVMAELDKADAVVPVMPLIETPKELDEHGCIVRHLVRSRTVSAQTPQGFSFPAILAAHRLEDASVRTGAADSSTDDAELWGRHSMANAGGYPDTGDSPKAIHTVPGDPNNRKITFPEDLPPCCV